VAAYDEAIEDFKRYHAMLPALKEACNDLGIAYAKLGVLATSPDSPLGRWQTRSSLERSSAVNYVNLARDDGAHARAGRQSRRRQARVSAVRQALPRRAVGDGRQCRCRQAVTCALVR